MLLKVYILAMEIRDNFMLDTIISKEDNSRCQGSLSLLAKHIKGSLVITGGIATAWHCVQNKHQLEKQPLNDIDIIVENISALPQSITEDFLVSHFHPLRERGKILLQLVEQKYKTRIDIFTPYSFSLMNRVKRADFSEITCKIVSAEDLTARLLAILYPVTNGRPCDPKYYGKFNLLYKFADLEIVRQVWLDYRKEDYLESFDLVVDAIHRYIAKDPNILCKDSYSQDLEESCPWCVYSDSFPLSPKSKIFDILGYV